MKRNTIGIDCTIFGHEPVKQGVITSSLAIFLADILDGLSRLGETEHFSLIVNSAYVSYFRKRFPGYRICPAGGLRSVVRNRLKGEGCSGRTIKKLGLFKRCLKRHHISRVWFPWMVPEEIVPARDGYIGTCHDLRSNLANSDETCRRMYQNAVHTVVLSTYVKQQLLNYCPIPAQKLSVIPNCISLAQTQVDQQPVPELVGHDFLLDVNAFVEHKNALTLLRAFERIKDKIPYDLVLCGAYPNQGRNEYDCRTFIREHGLADRVFICFAVPEAQKNWLFTQCRLFVNPSMDEGFGRTPVEAALCGKSVITTKVTSLEEATCGLLHYYDPPQDDVLLSEMMLEILSHPDSGEKLNEIREIFREKYALTKIAGEYLELFRRVGWLQ